MPNWCEGTLKVRGTKANITRWVNEALQPCGFSDSPQEKMLTWSSDGMIATVEELAWIKDSYRGFIIEGSKINLWNFETDDEELIIFVKAEFAWGVDVEKLALSSKEFNVDYRFYGFEQGMEFNQEVEIIKGTVTLNKKYKFDDYQWECACPTLGG